MEQNSSKISPWQMYAILILARIMHTMIYYSGRPGTELMLTILITTLIEIPACIPLVMFISEGGTDIASEVGGKKGAGAIRLLYSLYFLYISTGTVTNFSKFMNVEFPKIAVVPIVIAVLAVSAGYCAWLGIEALARAAGIVYASIIGLVVLMAIVSEGRLDTLNLLPVTLEDIPSMLNFAVRDITSSWWIPMLASLAPYLRGGVKKTAAAYIISKLAILELLAIIIILMLRDFVEFIGYPMLALGAYAKTDFIQHFDAINMLVWTLNCVTVNGAYLFIASRAAGKSRKILPLAASVALVTVGALLSYYNRVDYNNTTAFIIKFTGIVILGIILPFAALIIRRFRRYRIKCCENLPCS